MKTKINLSGAALVLGLFSFLNIHLSTVFAQGSLTPPGAPGATMLTLSQIEPRTPISSAPFTITKPGSYYLTTNLTVSTGDAIDINTNGVMLDLSGFTISSTELSGPVGTAIFLGNGVRNITIENGFIRSGETNNGSGVYSGYGFGNGIDFNFSGTEPANVLVSHVSVTGCIFDGIFVGILYPNVVQFCTVQTIGSYGIRGVEIENCSAVDCGNNAIDGQTVQNCYGTSSGEIGVSAGTSALNCYGVTSSGSSYGLYAGSAENCSGYNTGSGGTGLEADANALNCEGTGAGNGIGVYAYTAQNCYGYSEGSGDGVNAQNAENCYGTSVYIGVLAITALNCVGYSSSGGYGINAQNAENSYGNNSSNGYGLYAAAVASGCYGYSSAGTGLYAVIASVCHGGTGTGTALSSPHNVNSF